VDDAANDARGTRREHHVVVEPFVQDVSERVIEVEGEFHRAEQEDARHDEQDGRSRPAR
jgi:hypothetical protein